jgi:hypothetical protein
MRQAETARLSIAYPACNYSNVASWRCNMSNLLSLLSVGTTATMHGAAGVAGRAMTRFTYRGGKQANITINLTSASRCPAAAGYRVRSPQRPMVV